MFCTRLVPAPKGQIGGAGPSIILHDSYGRADVLKKRQGVEEGVSVCEREGLFVSLNCIYI